MTPRVEATVVVRTKNSAETLEDAFASIEAQTVEAEIVVVDSGSGDSTLEIARRRHAKVIELPPDRFTFGRALNVGAQASTTPIVLALSSHTRAADDRWIERCLAHHRDDRVAGCSGERYAPGGRPLFDTVTLDAETIRADPYWGFSNTASSWRRDVWERFPFDEQIEACEDKEWSWRVAEAGYVIVIDPRLTPSQLHRTRAGVRSLFERSRREARALAGRKATPPLSARGALDQWWNGLPEEPAYSPFLYRLNPVRAAEIAGRYAGNRDAGRHRER